MARKCKLISTLTNFVVGKKFKQKISWRNGRNLLLYPPTNMAVPIEFDTEDVIFHKFFFFISHHVVGCCRLKAYQVEVQNKLHKCMRM